MTSIAIDKDIATEPRLIAIADALSPVLKLSIIYGGVTGMFESGEDLEGQANRQAIQNLILGALVKIWIYADTHIRSDNILPISTEALADIAGLPAEYLEALPQDWINIRADGLVELPGYCQKNGIAGRKARASLKQQAQGNLIPEGV